MRKGNVMKNLTTSLGAALILASSMQLAAAAPVHHQRSAHRVTVHQQSRNADAYASWPAGRVDLYDSGPAYSGPAYSGGFSAPAGR
jgi:hypothetical protein